MVDANYIHHIIAIHLNSSITMNTSKYYIVLGLQRGASYEETRAAYKKLVLKYHPDKVQDNALKGEYTARFREVQEAYEKFQKIYAAESAFSKPPASAFPKTPTSAFPNVPASAFPCPQMTFQRGLHQDFQMRVPLSPGLSLRLQARVPPDLGFNLQLQIPVLLSSDVSLQVPVPLSPGLNRQLQMQVHLSPNLKVIIDIPAGLRPLNPTLRQYTPLKGSVTPNTQNMVTARYPFAASLYSFHKKPSHLSTESFLEDVHVSGHRVLSLRKSHFS